MTEKKAGMPDRFPNLSAPTTTAPTEITDEVNSSTNFKVKNFTSETNNTNYGKYEPFNIVSETRDSIYYNAEPIEELTQGGQAYISFYKVRKIVNEELEKRLGPYINNKNEQ